MTQPRRRPPFLELRPTELDPAFREELFLGRFDGEALKREIEAADRPIDQSCMSD